MLNDSVFLIKRDYFLSDFALNKKEKSRGVYGKRTTLYDNYKFNESKDKDFYDKEVYNYDEDVYNREDDFWEENRLEALNKDEKLTMLGYYLAKIPLEPRLGRMAIMSIPFGCFEHIVSICCSLGYRDPFMIPIDNKGKVECDEAKLRFSCQSNSDQLKV